MIRFLKLCLLLCLFPTLTLGEEPQKEAPLTAAETAKAISSDPRFDLKPFGSNLFGDHAQKDQSEGASPNYVITYGDRISVHAWGAFQLSETLTVDSQGNIILPEVGPIHVAGVLNKDLSTKVSDDIGRVYKSHFKVYTNLLSAKPVSVYVTGFVENPGRYPGLPIDSLLYFLNRAGGIRPDLGSFRDIEIIRDGVTLKTIDLYDFILYGKTPQVQFMDNDVVLVKRRGATIALRGDVAQESLIEFKGDSLKGDTLLEIVPEAADAKEVVVTGLRDGQIKSFAMPVRDFGGFVLRNGDQILVQRESHISNILVHLSGAYEGTSVMTLKNGTTLHEAFDHIRFNPAVANISSIYIKRPSVAAYQKRAILDNLYRLEKSAMLALSGSKGESEIRVKEAEMTQNFVQRAKDIEPLGIVVTATQKGAQENIVLEDGDTIVIPRITDVVQIDGEVLVPTAVVFQNGLPLEKYVKMAGGYTDRADWRRPVILRSNGQVLRGNDTVIVPGDRILIIPHAEDKGMQFALDITTILYQMAVAAGVVIKVI